MKDYSAYLFDVDGTLLDTRELIYRSFVFMCKEMGVPEPTRQTVDAGIGLVMQPQLEVILGPDRTEEEYKTAYRIYMEYQLRDYARHLRPFTGAVEVVRELAGLGKKLAVVSSRSRPSLTDFLAEFGMLEYFPVVVSPEDTKKHKPDPEPARKALELLDCRAGESVFIGDAEFDMTCGSGAGTDVVLVAWGGMRHEGWDVQPDLVVHAFTDILPD